MSDSLSARRAHAQPAASITVGKNARRRAGYMLAGAHPRLALNSSMGMARGSRNLYTTCNSGAPAGSTPTLARNMPARVATSALRSEQERARVLSGAHGVVHVHAFSQLKT